MKEMNKLAEYLRQSDDIIVIGHTNPDGDAHGSVIGLTLALQKMGKRAAACLPGGFNQLYADFDCPVEVASDEHLPFVPKTAFAVDVSEVFRLGALKDTFFGCERRALMDHHESNTGFAEVNVIDPAAAAAGEMAVELIEALGVELDAEIATWLYIAVVTDCGRFGYSCTRPQTMRAAAKLLEAGIDVDDITRKVYSTRSEGRTRLLARVISEMQFAFDKQVCYALLTPKMYEECGAAAGDNESIVNYLLDIRGVQIAFIVEEKGVDAKVSLRSKPPVDVGANVAQPLGGGGHACASGVTLKNMPIESALEKVLEYAGQAL